MSRWMRSAADIGTLAGSLLVRGWRAGALSLLARWWRAGALSLLARWWRAGARSLLARWWRAGVLSLLARWWRASVQTARLAIGIPDYDNYADHMRRNHPALVPMTRDEFFHERMLARYGKGRSRCC